MTFVFSLFVTDTPLLGFFFSTVKDGFKNSLCERVVRFGYQFLIIFLNYLGCIREHGNTLSIYTHLFVYIFSV